MNNKEIFSALKRHKYIHSLSNEVFDLLIFGGGITGAGIALDAASRGLKVALVERNDFASGTSSRSTKLVHGGLRYLQKLQFKFVAQLGRERKILYNNATHNVIPTPVILPIYKQGKLNRTLTYFAIKLYDLLAGVKPEQKVRWIKKHNLINKYPMLDEKGLLGAFKYYEYKTNDGRLVIECLKQASEHGALCLNFIKTLKLKYSDNKVSGAYLIDGLTNTEIRVKAKSVVNATGVWSDKFLANINETIPKTLYPTKGVHFVVSRLSFPINEAFYFDTHDKRMVFAIPKHDFVYVGTTDTPFTENLSNTIANKNDISYLLKAVNNKFKNSSLGFNNIISTWAGIRPLLHSKHKKAGEISRKDELFVSKTGLVTIVGGKLTGYRLMAKRVVDHIFNINKQTFTKCKTQFIKLSGSRWEHTPELHELIEYNDTKFDEAKQTGIETAAFKVLFYRYGTNIDAITEQVYEYRNEFNDANKVWLKAEVWYSVNYEMTCTLLGFFAFRTEKVLFESEKLPNELIFVADCMADFLKWDNNYKAKQIADFKEQWKQYQVPKTE